MKLSPYQSVIEPAYQVILHDIALRQVRPDYAFNFIHWRPAHVHPREQPYPTIPLPVTEYPISQQITQFVAKEKMFKLVAFQATFHESVTSITPDMISLIMDTGVSMSISPFITDFISPIRPTQHITIIKGIASGLNVAGVGDMAYTFLNDNGVEQTITLKNRLYLPQSAIRRVCLRQIGTITGHQEDGLYAQHSDCKLIVEGQVTTLKYDTLSQLLVLFTTPGITGYLTFANTVCVPTESNSITS